MGGATLGIDKKGVDANDVTKVVVEFENGAKGTLGINKTNRNKKWEGKDEDKKCKDGRIRCFIGIGYLFRNK